MSCPSGKVTYTSKKIARKVAKDMHRGGKPRPFTCPACGGIHLGHKPLDVRNGTRDKADWLHQTGREPR